MADTLIAGTTIIEDKRSEKGEVWSCGAENFSAGNPDTDRVYNQGESNITMEEDGINMYCPVYLPQGVTITAVKVYGNAGAAAETVYLFRNALDSTGQGIVCGPTNINTEETTIAEPIVDNMTYRYWIATSTMDTGDSLYGVRIKYEF